MSREYLPSSVLEVLCYFEVFRHPLTAEEILHFLRAPEVSLSELHEVLEHMVAVGRIWQNETFYQSTPDAQWLAQRREKNERAALFLPKAYEMGKFIGQFPFVRAVMVSGSLSKNTMAPDGDIDFFLITHPDRLWLARTLLVLFKKVFLFNSHKYFCINYLIDSNHLEIEEKNRFTATECATLLPVYNPRMYHEFMATNDWVKQQFYPNCQRRNTDRVHPETEKWPKRLLETLFSGFLGNWADRICMQVTVRFWRRKFRHFSQKNFDIALKSRQYVSKHHPLGFQDRVLNQYQVNITEALFGHMAEK
jgi:hypothetical protein